MDNNIQRNFIIGEEWLYYKIYTGRKTADYILTEVLKPIIDKLTKQQVITKWFFIRYEDPKFHIRLRFNFSSDKNLILIISTLKYHLKKNLKQKLIWKVEIDTYQREIERYGEDTIEFAEDIFCFDSVLIVSFLNLIEGDDGENIRWLFSLYQINNLLDNFNYREEDKLSLLKNLKTGFGNEFGMNRNLKRQLDVKYRLKSNIIESFMNINEETDAEYSPILKQVELYNNNIRPIAKEILDKKANVNLNSLVSSFIHMMMNRLFISRNRLHEMVIYDFLYRYYSSKIARIKHEKLRLN